MENVASKRLVLGCGTGRCGTKSLARLLMCQLDTLSTHEGHGWTDTPRMASMPLLPWKAPWRAHRYRLRVILARKAAWTCDVGFYHIRYAGRLLREFPAVRMICLQRDRWETIESSLRKVRDANIWQDHDGVQWRNLPRLDPAFLKFNDELTREAACGHWWDWYYGVAEWAQRVYPDKFRIFPMEDMNDEGGVHRILAWAGYPESRRNVQFGVHLNRLMSSLLTKPDTLSLQSLVDGAVCPGVRILEVGSWDGHGSTQVFKAAVERHEGHLTCVDLWDGLRGTHAPTRVSTPSGRVITMRELFNATAGYSEHVTAVQGRSGEVLPTLAERSFDLIFIDGGHDYHTVHDDIANARKLLKPGGVLCGHDYHNNLPGVMRAVDELPAFRQLPDSIWVAH